MGNEMNNPKPDQDKSTNNPSNPSLKEHWLDYESMVIEQIRFRIQNRIDPN